MFNAAEYGNDSKAIAAAIANGEIRMQDVLADHGVCADCGGVFHVHALNPRMADARYQCDACMSVLVGA